MKKINISKVEYVFEEISAEFNYETLNLVERGLFGSVFHAYQNYVNAGYVGVPYCDRYIITKATTATQKRNTDNFFQRYFYLVEDKNNKKIFKNDYLLSIFGE